MADDFWRAPSDSSLVKIVIVVKYFDAWSNVMLSRTRGNICYADLYAGRGKYDDGTLSVPLLILQRAIDEPRLGARLMTVFNEADSDTHDHLASNVASFPGVDQLRHRPMTSSLTVGRDDAQLIAPLPSVPTITFLDPFGYSGISLDLIDRLTSGFGRECIVFFNTNRINAAVSNLAVQPKMEFLFGAADWPAARARIEAFQRIDRELAVVEEFVQALKRRGMEFVLPFRVRNQEGTRASHHLIHVCRHVRGYTIMKEIMAGESSGAGVGVPRFEYNPADQRYGILFEYARPFSDLQDLLLERFAGRTLSMAQVFDEHQVGTPFIAKNYKDVLRQMEEDDLIEANPPAPDRPKRKGKATFADTVMVTFPAREAS
ncbi:MAG: three-Cys-motif partner protein TcmP [Armatimonadota bacterium]